MILISTVGCEGVVGVLWSLTTQRREFAGVWLDAGDAMKSTALRTRVRELFAQVGDSAHSADYVCVCQPSKGRRQFDATSLYGLSCRWLAARKAAAAIGSGVID